MNNNLHYLNAEWPAPKSIAALTTQRLGGVSQGHFATNNFGLHTGDELHAVTANRQRLKYALNLPSEPQWLSQHHSNQCVVIEQDNNRLVDAAVSRDKTKVLAILTADCLPILLCNQQGNEIAAIHAGWRGLVNGIIENTLALMQSDNPTLIAWIGPGICGQCYTVRQDVHDSYLSRYPFASAYFKQVGLDQWLIDLAGIAQAILIKAGIGDVFQSKACTFEQDNYYSYRRNQQTGRIASLIWFNGLS